MMAMAVPSTLRLSAWARSAAGTAAWAAPDAEVKRERHWLMLQSHVMVVIPLLATLLTHGFG
jgi:putative membrane protein